MLGINEVSKTNIGSNGRTNLNGEINNIAMRIAIRPSEQIDRMYCIVAMVEAIVEVAKTKGLDFIAVEDEEDNEVVTGIIAVLRHACRYYDGNNDLLKEACMKLKRQITYKGMYVAAGEEAAAKLYEALNKIKPCTIKLEDKDTVNALFTDPEYLNQLIIW